MPGFTTSFLFPDINVWVALSSGRHVHHDVANDWYQGLEDEARFCFCRFTQLGLLRLLTAQAVMRDDVLSQKEAWVIYDSWMGAGRSELLDEPPGLEDRFRSLTRSRHAAPKAWAEAYLAAFAQAAQITLVTFDAGFRGKIKPLVLLGE